MALYNHVANFVTDGTNLKVSSLEFKLVDALDDVSLVEAWQWDPQTIERVIEFSNKYDDDATGGNHAAN